MDRYNGSRQDILQKFSERTSGLNNVLIELQQQYQAFSGVITTDEETYPEPFKSYRATWHFPNATDEFNMAATKMQRPHPVGHGNDIFLCCYRTILNLVVDNRTVSTRTGPIAIPQKYQDDCNAALQMSGGPDQIACVIKANKEKRLAERRANKKWQTYQENFGRNTNAFFNSAEETNGSFERLQDRISAWIIFINGGKNYGFNAGNDNTGGDDGGDGDGGDDDEDDGNDPCM